MTFVSGYWMLFNLFRLEQIYNSILCNTMVLSSKIIVVSKNDRVWPKMHNHRLQANPWHREGGSQSRQNLSSYSTIYMYISSSFYFQWE